MKPWIILIYLVATLIVVDIALHWGDEPYRYSKPDKEILTIDLRKNYKYISFIRSGGGDDNSWEVWIPMNDLRKIVYFYHVKGDELMKFVTIKEFIPDTKNHIRVSGWQPMQKRRK